MTLMHSKISTEIDVHVDSSHVELDTTKRIHFVKSAKGSPGQTQSFGSFEEKLDV
jgi:hypothetical protein